MSKNTKLVLLRLSKEQTKLNSEPLDQAWVAREGVLNFHFCIHSLDGHYEGGFYHGVLQLSEDYPFSPPQLLFYTPSGRFEIDKPICTSFTNFHKESWASTWNVRTMILATISFMNSEEQGAGYMSSSFLTKRQYAKQSMDFNLKNPLFKELFKKQLNNYRKKPVTAGVSEEKGGEKEKNKSFWDTYGIYVLTLLLVLLIVGWITVKNT